MKQDLRLLESLLIIWKLPFIVADFVLWLSRNILQCVMYQCYHEIISFKVHSSRFLLSEKYQSFRFSPILTKKRWSEIGFLSVKPYNDIVILTYIVSWWQITHPIVCTRKEICWEAEALRVRDNSPITMNKQELSFEETQSRVSRKMSSLISWMVNQ